jgi:pimeloyl-ACP methyl ester carboxylesterase
VRVRPIQKKISIPVRQLPPVVERQLAEMGVDLGAIPEHDDGVGYLRTVARIEVEAGDMAADLLTQIYRHPRLFRSRKNAERWIALTERVSLIADLDREDIFTVADLRRLAMPMLVLVGGNSSTLPSAREMVRICPHAVLKEVPDVGHFFPMSQPRLFLRPTLRFLRAVETGRARAQPGD